MGAEDTWGDSFEHATQVLVQGFGCSRVRSFFEFPHAFSAGEFAAEFVVVLDALARDEVVEDLLGGSLQFSRGGSKRIDQGMCEPEEK